MNRTEPAAKELKRAAPDERLLALRLQKGSYKFDCGEMHKRCSRCKEYWPADSEFFYSAATRDGLNDWCKACYIENRYPTGRNSEEEVK
jgi:hypothetical protein